MFWKSLPNVNAAGTGLRRRGKKELIFGFQLWFGAFAACCSTGILFITLRQPLARLGPKLVLRPAPYG